jgi:hypothetical protein
MGRPRWHDAAIVGAIVALLAVGVWALWWDDVRSWISGPNAGSSSEPAVDISRPQT